MNSIKMIRSAIYCGVVAWAVGVGLVMVVRLALTY